MPELASSLYLPAISWNRSSDCTILEDKTSTDRFLGEDNHFRPLVFSLFLLGICKK